MIVKLKNYSNFVNEAFKVDNLNDWYIFGEKDILLHIFANSFFILFAHCINLGIDPPVLVSGQINDPFSAAG
jgi:hypothetical protein